MSYAADCRRLRRLIRSHDPLYTTQVRLKSVVSVVGLCAPSGYELGVATAKADAESLDVEAFLRELDSWADAENHQPSVLQTSA